VVGLLGGWCWCWPTPMVPQVAVGGTLVGGGGCYAATE